MEHMHSTALRRGLAATALVGGALTIALVGGTSASADGDAGAAAAPATITMQFEKGKFFFSGAKQVRAGSNLRIRNNTEPQKGGPHTFSLVTESVLPNTPMERKQCFGGGICGPIAAAQRFDEDTGKVGRPLVMAGKPGWDRPFTSERKGDTWYSETDGETFSQRVSARRGKTLRYVCAIHPEMQGKIKVIGRR